MEGRELLEKYVTNTDDQVFGIHNLQGMVGAVMARYSRAEGGLRQTLLREFVKENQLNPRKAGKLIDRVLIAYGDDSVGELEGAHLSFENISMLATKAIEHRRIGGSPIEQSTRYVRYDFRDEISGYHYHRPESLQDPEVMATFQRLMDRIFDGYREMWQPLTDYLAKRKPLETAEYELSAGRTWREMTTDKQRAAFQRTYRTDIKTKVCDILRAFLPLATRANVGLFGNGRYFQHLISKMLTSPLSEVNFLGEKAFEELSKLIPHYVKRAQKMTYLAANRQTMEGIVDRYFGDLEPDHGGDGIHLIEPDHQFIAARLAGVGSSEAVRSALIDEENLSFTASLVYGYARGSFTAIRGRLKKLPRQVTVEVLDAYYGERQVRRDRPERGIEFGYPHNFDLVTEWAVYKDLMRHRMGTIMIQPMAPDLGFDMPGELESAGLADIGRRCIALAEELYAFLGAKGFRHEREYAMLQGHRVRWFLGMNDRALMHLVELRTTPQGHTNYRAAAQKMHRLLAERFPDRAARMNHVNHEESYWARGDAEARQRRKEEALDME